MLHVYFVLYLEMWVCADVPLENFDVNSSLHNFFLDNPATHSPPMARGGVGEVIQMIHRTKVPIICICNDRCDAVGLVSAPAIFFFK